MKSIFAAAVLAATISGVGAGALMIADRRSSGAYIEDEGIEVKAFDRIGKKYKDNKDRKSVV